jgi:hypothetical protein
MHDSLPSFRQRVVERECQPLVPFASASLRISLPRFGAPERLGVVRADSEIGGTMQPHAAWREKASSTRAGRALGVAAGVAALLLAAASPTIAAAPKKGGEYGYSSDENWVNFTVSRRGTRLTEVDLYLGELPCSNGRKAFGQYQWSRGERRPAHVSIARDGTFSAMFVEPHPHPFAVSEEYWLSGRFIRRGRAARVVMRARHVGEGGTICDTGDVRVTAGL